MAVDVADLLAADADRPPRLFCLWCVAGAQPQLPNPLITQWGRQKDERMKMRKLTRRLRWKEHTSSNKVHINNSKYHPDRRKCYYRHRRCLTSER